MEKTIPFKLSQLAKVEIIGATGLVANLAIAQAIIEPDNKTKTALLVTAVPVGAVTALTATKLAAEAVDKEVFATISVSGDPIKVGKDFFYTATYGGRLILES